MTDLFVDPVSGASGDMLLGALVDAGVPLERIRSTVAGLGVAGWTLRADAVMRGGLAATQVVVATEESGVQRTWADVRGLLEAAELPGPVRERALATFLRLARVEARIHRRDLERVHFHEVGALDALVDVVGVCAGLHALGVTSVTCGPVPQGTGTVRGEHGLLPLPAPAVLELLVGAPVHSTGEPVELTTPTGAALLAEWTDTWGPLPAMTVEGVGYGAGSRELTGPNVVRLVLGRRTGGGTAAPGQTVVLETAVDDLPGELVAHVLDALRAAGASDAYARPVLMKKGRPGVELVCLAPPDRADALRAMLFRETTTLGVRVRRDDRWTLERSWVQVDVAGSTVRLKVGSLDGEVRNVAPEYEDCAAAARVTGLPLKEVYARARAAWRPEDDAPPRRPPDRGGH